MRGYIEADLENMVLKSHFGKPLARHFVAKEIWTPPLDFKEKNSFFTAAHSCLKRATEEILNLILEL